MVRTAAMSPTSFRFTLFLGLLAALPALSIDLSAPTLALLPSVLRTSNLVAGLTLSLFMGGFALGQLSGGNLSDRLGRRPVLLLGFAVYTAAGAACAMASSGPGMVACRFVQGLGAGMVAVLSFAMVQDLFEGAAARGKRAYVTVVVGAAPILAPAIGAAIVEFAGWRAVHVVLALGGLGLLAVVWLWVGESRRQGAPGTPPPDLSQLWQDRRFIALAVVNAFSYGAVFAYIAGSPVVVMSYYGGSARLYAAIFACTAAALTLGAWSAGRLGRRGVGADTLLSVSLAGSAATSVALTAVAMTGARGAAAGWAAMGLMALISYLRGISSPNLQHLAIDRQRHQAGAAAAAVGVSQLLGGALSSVAVAGLLTRHGPLAVAVPITVSSVAAALLWMVSGRYDTGPEPWQPRVAP